MAAFKGSDTHCLLVFCVSWGGVKNSEVLMDGSEDGSPSWLWPVCEAVLASSSVKESSIGEIWTVLQCILFTTASKYTVSVAVGSVAI